MGYEDNILFTPASLLELLSSIDELKDYTIGITETIDGNLQCQIGDSVYDIQSDMADEVAVDSDVIDEIDDINQTAYDELGNDFDTYDTQDIESGIIKEVAKTLLLGGMVRLTTDMLKKE